MRENNRKPIEKCIKKLPQFTTMNVIDGQAGLVNYSSLIFYSLTIDNILNIIVLLILAGVSISMLTGENGILNQAAKASEMTDDAEVRENITMAYNSAVTKKYAEGSTDFIGDMTEELEKTYGEGNVTITESDGKYTVVIDGVGTYEIDENGNISEPIDAKYIPNVSYIVGATENATEDINGQGAINEGETAYVIVTVNIQEGSISSVTPDAGLTEVSNSDGKYVYSVTKDGEYTITVVSNSGTENEYTKTETITVSGAYKIANMPDSWQPANSSNTNNDWYAYKDASGNIATVNAPKLEDGMTAIKYVAGTDTTTYETLTAGSQWANAMTKDGSMWVWIPRFAYQITSGYNTNTAGTIEIVFLKDNTNEFLDSSITGTVVSGSDVTEATYSDSTKWILAPGFTLGDEQLSGFWFAKFEASNTAGYGDSSDTANNVNLTLQIKPNKTSWRSITSANMFTVCQNLTNATNYSKYFNNVSNVDTHMTKNVEWGAVAYLAHSKYGLNGQEICINTNSSYLTGMGSGSTTSTGSTTNEYNTTTGITASTTKNVYGIYDMSGGAWEYVAACLSGYTNKLTSETDTDYINKYIDVYSSYNQTKYGDAVYETSSSSSNANSWFNDYSNFVLSDYPVFVRGGHWSHGSGAGLFHFSYDSGNASSFSSFRPVCVVK